VPFSTWLLTDGRIEAKHRKVLIGNSAARGRARLLARVNSDAAVKYSNVIVQAIVSVAKYPAFLVLLVHGHCRF
jgi:hypothetical protein